MARARPSAINFYPTPDRPIPKPILFGAAALAIGAIVVIGAGRVTGVGLAGTPAVATVAQRGLALDERPDGSAALLDARSRAPLITVGEGEGAFAIEALRNLQRNRLRKGIDSAEPFVLALKADGRLVLEDPQTPQQIELRAFGSTNIGSFAALLDPAREENR
ncbi:photosynthetic complex assembly protein PuhC [Aurantimonas sp. HBX-1]|uniref:photosynthetic complex assembly protein PuhC n=1 Tax=Aurantimonas sp. HBX-1 TaxID=2906072 RepID=UPI001EEF108F|nr:photosynthetic complex assembly protein PuhC [Aurantimonas sp. HBX-1]UIJ73256.1 hypothetical protein LXB15_06320 [Aurantimonas sp. HBX-1]